MARIAPFAGIHYNPQRATLADLIAPPYDVIAPDAQDALYARSPDNIVRLILNRAEPGDNGDSHARYRRAAAFLRDELAGGALVQDETPALYEYIQRFPHTVTRQPRERRALLVALGLEPYENGVVLPHEETHPKAKADRLELMRATRANPEPIYGLYEDPELAIYRRLESARQGQKPLLTATVATPNAPEGETHVIYRHTDPALLADLAAWFAPRRVWIADGHHRYETALNYQRERRDAAGENATADAQPYDFLLIGLSAFEDDGLVVLPTHRLIRHISSDRLAQLPLQLERYFDVVSMSADAARVWIARAEPGQKRFVLLRADGAFALTLRNRDALAAATNDGHCAAWRELDVTILQTLVLDRSLGISWQSLAHTPDVAYTRDEDEAAQRVASGEFQLACLLQNPTVTEVRDVAAAGDKMPQKSTFFYPKLWSGLVVRSLE